MRGKIDKDGYLWKEVPGGKWIKCDCVNWACGENDCAPICRHDCVAFEGPIPEKRCMQIDGDGTKCVNNCDICPLHLPTGRTEIHYCQGILRFDEFVDERVPK